MSIVYHSAMMGFVQGFTREVMTMTTIYSEMINAHTHTFTYTFAHTHAYTHMNTQNTGEYLQSSGIIHTCTHIHTQHGTEQLQSTDILKNTQLKKSYLNYLKQNHLTGLVDYITTFVRSK